jgi:hypothetical protein
MVHIFFIISGYVLSYKPLEQIHSQQFSALGTTLSSFDFSEEVIELLLKQKDTLADLKDYILCCGAKETRITKRWERLE